jgi:hypothetical protein
MVSGIAYCRGFKRLSQKAAGVFTGLQGGIQRLSLCTRRRQQIKIRSDPSSEAKLSGKATVFQGLTPVIVHRGRLECVFSISSAVSPDERPRKHASFALRRPGKHRTGTSA